MNHSQVEPNYLTVVCTSDLNLLISDIDAISCMTLAQTLM